MSRKTIAGAAALVLLAAFCTPAQCESTKTVRVILTGGIEPTKEIITVGDIADITGGDLYLRRKISALDIAKVDESTKTQLPKRQVVTRILLAGIPAEEFHVGGHDQVLIRPASGKSSEQRVLEFLQPDVAFRMGVDPADVELRLTRPIANASELFPKDSWLGHFLPATLRPGPLNVKLGVYEGDRLLKTAIVPLQIQLNAVVYVATRNLESGTILTVDDFEAQRRLLSGLRRDFADETIVGKTLRRRIPSGQIVRTADIGRTPPPSRQVVVRSRDVVEAVAKRKALSVRVSGLVALDSGAVGDAIRVRNPTSDTILTARVVHAGLVSVEL